MKEIKMELLDYKIRRSGINGIDYLLLKGGWIMRVDIFSLEKHVKESIGKPVEVSFDGFTAPPWSPSLAEWFAPTFTLFLDECIMSGQFHAQDSFDGRIWEAL